MAQLDVARDWQSIRNHLNRSFATNFHVSIASVDDQGLPSLTPIGTLFLNREATSGYYFEKYPRRLPLAAQGSAQVCVLVVNSGMCFWLKGLFRNRFSAYPAIRLYGKLGAKRQASEREIQRLRRRMRFTRWLKGNHYLWSDMQDVREIHFTRAEMVTLGEMTSHLK